jgi:hypothetical protein
MAPPLQQHLAVFPDLVLALLGEEGTADRYPGILLPDVMISMSRAIAAATPRRCRSLVRRARSLEVLGHVAVLRSGVAM